MCLNLSAGPKDHKNVQKTCDESAEADRYDILDGLPVLIRRK